MRVLIVGHGGREHAMAWKIAQSELLEKLFIAPGNSGTAELGTNLAINADDIPGLKKAAIDNKIDLVVVGPEDPLVLGIVDEFAADPATQHIGVLGPRKEGAQLEGSKDYAKEFMNRHNIPTASHRSFTQAQISEGIEYLNTHPLPVVLKADGLAAGKGVKVCYSRQEAEDFLTEIFKDRKFGEAGNKVVVESFLPGIELSVFIMTDGTNYILLPEAKDYKRVGEGDTGLNTGGMGAVSPVPFATKNFMKKVEHRIVLPTLSGLRKDGISYRGFIFFGLMAINGEPYVIEYNVRMGDPETEVVFPRIASDILPLMKQAADGRLDADLLTEDRYAVTVVAVSGGYPGGYEKGHAIEGLKKVKTSIVFHAGAQTDGKEIVTSGGRVVAVTSKAEKLQDAIGLSYEALKYISFQGMYYRRDIGSDLLKTF